MRRYVSGDAFAIASGVPVTSLERTVLDCARPLGFREGLAVADSALRVWSLRQEGLLAYVGSMNSGYRGSAQARMSAARADARNANGGESIARAAMYELGFATPDLQIGIPDPLSPGQVYYVDYRWALPGGGEAFGELDGGEKYSDEIMTQGHDTTWVMRRERRRESRLTVRHAGIMRFPLEEVADAEFFNGLLELFGVPRDHEPLIEIPAPPSRRARRGLRLGLEGALR